MTLADLLQAKRLTDAAESRAVLQQRALRGAQEKPIMATSPVVPAPTAAAPKPNGFVSFLKHFGADAKKVLAWVASPKGQALVTTGEVLGESVADAIDPALAGLNPVINSWTQEIFKAEALGAAAANADPAATSLQKSAVVIAGVAPQVIAYCQANKLAIPTGANMQAANDALVAFLNALGGPTAAQPAQ